MKLEKRLAISPKKKKNTGKPLHNKKYLKAEKKKHKRSLLCICTQVILIDSVYRKDENYYRTVFLEKYTFNDV